jgi:hypothetical protein
MGIWNIIAIVKMILELIAKLDAAKKEKFVADLGKAFSEAGADPSRLEAMIKKGRP